MLAVYLGGSVLQPATFRVVEANAEHSTFDVITQECFNVPPHIVGVGLVRFVADVKRRDALMTVFRQLGLEPLGVVSGLDERTPGDGDGDV